MSQFNVGSQRMRDRRAPIAVLVLAVAYVAVVASGIAVLGHALTGDPAPAISSAMSTVIAITLGLLLWRIAVRCAITARTYGWREARWSIPRLFVANVIALLAARRAVMRYAGILRGATPRWDKTAHVFPDTPEPAAR